MPLSDQETTALDIIARYSFLTECQEKGYIAEDKYKEIVFGFRDGSLGLSKGVIVVVPKGVEHMVGLSDSSSLVIKI